MAYDPTKPADNTLADAGEIRNQFAGLKQLHDGLQLQVDNMLTPDDVDDHINANAAGPIPAGLGLLGMTVSNPPTQAQVQAIANKIDDLIDALRRV